MTPFKVHDRKININENCRVTNVDKSLIKLYLVTPQSYFKAIGNLPIIIPKTQTPTPKNPNSVGV